MKDNNIQHIMNTEVVTASPNCLLKKAILTMQQKHVVFLVVTLNQKPIGILTERDVVRFANECIDLNRIAVKHVMHSPVITVQEEDSLFKAYDVLSQHKVNHIIVINKNDNLAGVLTRTHILGGLSVEHFIALKQVEDIMTTTIPRLSAQDTVAQALHAMNKWESSCVIISKQEEDVVGIITEQDIMHMYVSGIVKGALLENIMSRPVCTVDRRTFIPAAHALMREKKFRHLGVVDEEKQLIGLISQADIEHRIEDSYLAFLQALVKQQSEPSKDEHEKFSVLFSQNPNAVFNHDLQGKIITVNSSCLALTGFSKEALVSKHPNCFIHPDDIKYAQDSFNKATEGKSGHAEFRVRRTSGETLYVFNSYLPIYVKNKLHRIFSIMHDITEKKKAQEKIRKAEEQVHLLAAAVEQAGDSVVITDISGTIKFVNPAFSRITGYTKEEVLGKTPSVLKSGEQDASFYRTMWQTITQGNTWHSRLIDRRKNGDFFPAELTISPVKGDDAVITHFVGIKRDLTEREELDGRFRQAQKMEAIGTLVGGIAHDFNNMLAGITGNLYLARHQLDGQTEVLERMDHIEELSFRAADMIQQLLTFARKSAVSMKKTPFTSLLKELLKLLKTSVPENIQLNQHICNDVMHILGDATQLHQVLMNLINNARDAVEHVPEPTITITLDLFYADASLVKKKSYVKEGRYARLRIEDNGHGIEKKDLDHLFDPFFTTKPQGKGTGLGLSMVFGAVKSHQGFVEVESTVGEGSVFYVFLPLLKEDTVTTPTSRHALTSRGDRELILLVDDENDVRQTTVAVLESLNYRLLQAKDGIEALSIFQQQQHYIDLVISDVVMPRCGGLQLAKKIREINADVPIIFMTGYDASNILNNNENPLKNTSMLCKPIPFDALSQHIKQALGKVITP